VHGTGVDIGYGNQVAGIAQLTCDNLAKASGTAGDQCIGHGWGSKQGKQSFFEKKDQKTFEFCWMRQP
jgi:hypothetical protein